MTCTCQACEYGLWCADGERGVFVRGEDNCKRCGVIAWQHSTRRVRKERTPCRPA